MIRQWTLPPSSPLLNWLVVSSMLRMRVNWLDWKPSAPPFSTDKNDTNDVVESFTSLALTQARLKYVEVAGSEMGLYPTVYGHLLDALLTNAKRTTDPINFRITQQYAFDRTKNASSDFVIYVLELDVSVSVHVLYTYPFIMSSMLKMRVNWLDWKPSAPPFNTDTNDVVENFTSLALTQAQLKYVEVAGSEMGLYPTVYGHLLDTLLTHAKRATNPVNFRVTQQYSFD